MSRKTTRGRARRQQAMGPAFVVPKGVTKRDIQKMIEEAAAKAAAEPARPFRFRRQLLPLLWLLALPAALVLRAEKATLLIVAAALLVPVLCAAGARGGAVARGHVAGGGLWAGTWLGITAAAGVGWWTAIWLAGWAIPYGFWLHHYRWRPAEKTPEAAAAVEDDVVATFRELAERRKWSAVLGEATDLPGGGRSWPVACRGAHTHIDQIAGEKEFVAAAYDRPMTEAYVEPDPHGVKSRGTLVLLKAGTLDEPRPYSGAMIAADGLGCVGRFPDGEPVRQRWWVDGVGGGARHTIGAGVDGSGKTGFLDLDLTMSCRSGLVAPVILDPQMGQALPAWRDILPYAAGPDECMVFLRGLNAAMFARSEYLGQLDWTDAKGRTRRGMGFFDPHLTGLPFIEIVIDEAPILLAIKGALGLVLDIGKLGRKAGFRLVLAAQQPSLKELGDSALRSMLVGGNVFCFRTADKVSKGMINMPSDPERLPKYWRNGRPTVGLGYADTIDGRPWTPMRTDWPEDPYELAESCQPRPLDVATSEGITAARAKAAADADKVSAAAGEQAAENNRVLHLIDRPMTMGEALTAVMSATTLKVSEAALAIGQLEADGALRRSGDLIEVAP